MRKKWRRYEVLLPRRFNEGGLVPKAWLGEAVNEIVTRFGAVSFEKGKVEGAGVQRRGYIGTCWLGLSLTFWIRRGINNGFGASRPNGKSGSDSLNFGW